MGGRGLPASPVDITSLLRFSSNASNESPVPSPRRQLRPASVPSTPTTTPHDLLPPRVGPSAVAPALIPSNRRSMTPHVPDQPVKKQSKWSPEEDAIIIELRGRGMKWEDVSKRLPGRSAISCRLHYQNYLERRSEWDEERKNKLARLYERFKSDMWAKVAEELAVPWRAAEAMHWQLGEADMARRAGVVPFSLAAVNTSESSSNRALASRAQAPIQPQDNSALREMRPPSPPTGYSRSQLMPPMTSARTPRRGPINTQPPPPQQTRPMLPPQHMHQTPHPSPHTVVPGPPAPQQPPPPPAPAAALAHPLGDYRRSPGPGLAPIQPHPSSHNTGPLPGVAQLTTGMSPYGPPSGPPTPTSLPAIATPSMPRYVPLEQAGTKRRASPDMTRPDAAHRRRLA
ncbi:Myb [Trichoderma simmonsii]|uniref:Myb n=1 Tax=Trichoderma simmonsii TaxID=1491479 RepID=A0A8G0PHF1_9HYPO|nr:hypothetical protein Trihar35433_6499 [Trichoderma harzianum]QYT01477.1 Myb [Trichoderma simmonsii]